MQAANFAFALDHHFSKATECLKVPGETAGRELPCVRCTQVYYANDIEILVSSGSNTIFYRSGQNSTFKASPLDLNNPHSVVYLPQEKLFFISDTDNDRILAVSSLESGEIHIELSHIAGIELRRPHDIIYDPKTGWLYAINPLTPTIFRFRYDGSGAGSLDLSAVLGYSRSLSLVENRVYVAGSSLGRVVAIEDFDRGRFTVYQSFGKKNNAHAGSWEQDGLIINDVDHFQGFWYVSSFFCPSRAAAHTDHNVNKLIRFATWQDFEQGNWQDISGSLPDGMVPYYFTHHQNSLWLALFRQESPGLEDTVYRITTDCHALPATFHNLLR